MSKFRILVEETRKSIEARKKRIDSLYNQIMEPLHSHLDQIVDVYNSDPDHEVAYNIFDGEFTIRITFQYNPEVIQNTNTLMSFSYDLDLNRKLCYIDIFFDRDKLTPKLLSVYANSDMFEARIKHELLHYLDMTQSNFKLPIPDYEGDIDQQWMTYLKQPEEIHALLYSVIDVLKDKQVDLTNTEDIVATVNKADSNLGDTLADFFTYVDSKKVNKFMKSLYNALN